MGSQAWGGDGEWGGDHGWGGNDWGYQQGYEPQGYPQAQGYLRSLASLDNVPTIPTKNAFDSLADSSFEVPIADLIVPARRVRNKTRHKKKFIDQCGGNCGCSGSLSPSHAGPGRLPPTPLTMGGNPKPAEEPIDCNDPEMATAWTKRRAIRNYEKWHNDTHGTHLDYDTPIEVVARTSLGINGWALHEFGNQVTYPYDVVLSGSTRSHWAEDSCTTSIVGGGLGAVLPAGASDPIGGHSFIRIPGASDPFGGHRSGASDEVEAEWDSELELSDLEAMEGASEWEAENLRWQTVTSRSRKWGGRTCTSSKLSATPPTSSTAPANTSATSSSTPSTASSTTLATKPVGGAELAAKLVGGAEHPSKFKWLTPPATDP